MAVIRMNDAKINTEDVDNEALQVRAVLAHKPAGRPDVPGTYSLSTFAANQANQLQRHVQM